MGKVLIILLKTYDLEKILCPEDKEDKKEKARLVSVKAFITYLYLTNITLYIQIQNLRCGQYRHPLHLVLEELHPHPSL